jgi:hypothetical protein
MFYGMVVYVSSTALSMEATLYTALPPPYNDKEYENYPFSDVQALTALHYVNSDFLLPSRERERIFLLCTSSPYKENTGIFGTFVVVRVP